MSSAEKMVERRSFSLPDVEPMGGAERRFGTVQQAPNIWES
jgi:hypothetical protein